MRWRITNVVVVLEEATEAETEWMRGFLSYSDRRYNPRSGKYDTRQVSLLSLRGEFPTGLGIAAWREAKAKGYHVEIVDARHVPCAQVPDPQADLSWLRKHPAVTGEITFQTEAVMAVCKHRRGLIWAPTGSGKGTIAVGIAQAIPCRWLFLVHRLDLVEQQAARYESITGLQAGRIGDGRVSLPDGCRFIVASFQTMHAAHKRGQGEALRVLEEAEGLMVDEVHSLPADTYAAVTRRAVNAYYRVGMSATPLARGDGRNLMTIGGLGPVIYRIRPEELIRLGLLARPRIRMMEHRALCERPTWRGVYTEAVVRSRARNALVAQMTKQASKPALVFVQQVSHGRELEKLVRARGVSVEFVWGEEPLAIRRAAIQRLERGETEVLICSVIFQEGVDIPSLRSVVIAAGGASIIAALQRIGRGMRADKASAKTEFEVYDVFDAGCGCSASPRPEQHTGCRWLRRHSLERRKAYEAEGFTIETGGANYARSNSIEEHIAARGGHRNQGLRTQSSE